MALRTYRQLEVWQRELDWVEAVYVLARKLPADEKFGLVSQMQRAAVAITANIAEGYGRTHRGDDLRHLSIARGSLMEMETHSTIAVRLSFLSRGQVLETWRLTQQFGKMLTNLIALLEFRGPKT